MTERKGVICLLDWHGDSLGFGIIQSPQIAIFLILKQSNSLILDITKSGPKCLKAWKSSVKKLTYKFPSSSLAFLPYLQSWMALSLLIHQPLCKIFTWSHQLFPGLTHHCRNPKDHFLLNESLTNLANISAQKKKLKDSSTSKCDPLPRKVWFIWL